MDATRDFLFKWKLENFQKCLVSDHPPVYSPVFAANVPKQSYWRLKLYPCQRIDDYPLSCYLEYHHSNKCPSAELDFQLKILNVDNIEYASSHFKRIVFKPGCRYGAKEFAFSSDLVDSAPSLLPDGHLTIECRITVRYASNDDADLHRLSRVFLGLFWTSVFSDCVLKTKKERKFRVHRELIRARARKFYRVHGLGNNTQIGSSVRIPATPPDVLQAFLMYLYSGVIRSTDPEVLDRLYRMSERYEVFHLRGDIAPTPTDVFAITRMSCTSQTMLFPIRNFADVSAASLGRLLDVGFARLGIDYNLGADNDPQQIVFTGKFFVYDSDIIRSKSLICTLSVLDAPEGDRHFTSRHEISCCKPESLLFIYTDLKKNSLLNDKFLIGGAVYFRFTFTVVSTRDPVSIRSIKRREALSIGVNPPSIQTLQALSMDLGKLVESSPLPNVNPNIMPDKFNSMQKAVFSAWSWLFRDIFGTQKDSIPLSTRPFNPEAFKLLYSYMCTGNIPVPLTHTTYALYPVAKEYELATLRELIVKKVKSRLIYSTVVESLMFAFVYGIEELLDYVKKFIGQNYHLVAEEVTWKRLCCTNPDLVVKILGNSMNQSELLMDS